MARKRTVRRHSVMKDSAPYRHKTTLFRLSTTSVRLTRSGRALQIERPDMARHELILGLILAALATSPATAQPGEAITISLTDYAFTPSSLALKAGTAYRLRFTNGGSKDHNFTAPEFFF